QTCEALAAGAVEVIEKPGGRFADAAWEQMFLSTLRVVSRVRVITHSRPRLMSERGDPRPSLTDLSTQSALDGRSPIPRMPRQLVAIGASTGGPAAVLTVLKALPVDFALPILL